MDVEQIKNIIEEKVKFALNELDPVSFQNFCYDISNLIEEYLDGSNS